MKTANILYLLIGPLPPPPSQFFCSLPVHNWTVEDVQEWLVQDVDLPQYAGIFASNNIDGSVLPRYVYTWLFAPVIDIDLYRSHDHHGVTRNVLPRYVYTWLFAPVIDIDLYRSHDHHGVTRNSVTAFAAIAGFSAKPFFFFFFFLDYLFMSLTLQWLNIRAKV